MDKKFGGEESKRKRKRKRKEQKDYISGELSENLEREFKEREFSLFKEDLQRGRKWKKEWDSFGREPRRRQWLREGEVRLSKRIGKDGSDLKKVGLRFILEGERKKDNYMIRLIKFKARILKKLKMQMEMDRKLIDENEKIRIFSEVSFIKNFNLVFPNFFLRNFLNLMTFRI